MADKEQRKAQAAKHLSLMKGAFAAETAATIEAATIFEDGEGRALELPETPFEATKTSVTSAFATQAIHEAQGKTLVVSPTSFTRPGGNYEEGSFGPEQILCSESNLYPVLCGMKKAYHDANRGYSCGMLFTDRCMYLPDVMFIRNGAMRKADVLAIPEPNRSRALENFRSETECDSCLEGRIQAILNIAAAHEVQTLIMGAFGCGKQGFPPAQVIACIQKWIAGHPGAIENIVFAVSRMAFDAFDEAFGAPKVEEAAAPAAAEEEENEFDLSSIELPEGVTLR